VSRPFRFAVAADAPTGPEWRDVVHRIEDHGYSTLFLADHYHLPAGGHGFPPQHLAPLSAMATAAAWTTTLRVGTRVLCHDYHVPLALLKEVATIDVLSEGRVEFGIGAGWHADEYASMGIPFDDGPRRIDKLVEVVALAKACFAGETVDQTGDHVDVHGYEPVPLPVQRPHPPIMIGGTKRRVLGFAGREADIVSLSTALDADPDPMATLARKVEFARAGAGDRFDQLEVESMAMYVEITEAGGTASDDALERVSATFGGVASPEVLRDHPLVLVGSVDQIVERLEERRARLAINYVTVPARFLETFAPVVDRLSGN
jgi:probable F420-dependent oxidoreductase